MAIKSGKFGLHPDSTTAPLIVMINKFQGKLHYRKSNQYSMWFSIADSLFLSSINLKFEKQNQNNFIYIIDAGGAVIKRASLRKSL
jgi:hypothetical protein